MVNAAALITTTAVMSPAACKDRATHLPSVLDWTIHCTLAARLRSKVHQARRDCTDGLRGTVQAALPRLGGDTALPQRVCAHLEDLPAGEQELLIPCGKAHVVLDGVALEVPHHNSPQPNHDDNRDQGLVVDVEQLLSCLIPSPQVAQNDQGADAEAQGQAGFLQGANRGC